MFGKKNEQENELSGLAAAGSAPPTESEAQPKKTPTPPELLTPAAQGSVNAMVSAAVKEAVSSVFASLGPVLADMALTREKLELLRTPAKTPEQVARELRDLRETQNTREQEAELRKQIAARQAACPHLDKNQRDSLGIIRNYPDRQPRGICMLCHKLIEPKHWVIDSPYPMNHQDPAVRGKSRARLADADPEYGRVQRICSME